MRSSRFRTGLGLCLGLLLYSATQAGPVPPYKPSSYPDWWFERDVIVRLPAYSGLSPTTTPPLKWPDHYPTADDFAAANIGQLKSVASLAASELNFRLPGGAGTSIDQLISTWRSAVSDEVTRDDYSALNHGQLKTVAKRFYNRLYEAGLRGPPLKSGWVYPWSDTQSDDDAYAVVNLGQLKLAFCFNLTYGLPSLAVPDFTDLDGDGMHDPDEIFWFGNLASPSEDDADGDGLNNLQELNLGLPPAPNATHPDSVYVWSPLVLSSPEPTNQPRYARVMISNPNPLGRIVYTTDGSEPVAAGQIEGTVYSALELPTVDFSQNTRLIAGLYVNGVLRARIENTYPPSLQNVPVAGQTWEQQLLSTPGDIYAKRIRKLTPLGSSGGSPGAPASSMGGVLQDYKFFGYGPGIQNPAKSPNESFDWPGHQIESWGTRYTPTPGSRYYLVSVATAHRNSPEYWREFYSAIRVKLDTSTPFVSGWLYASTTAGYDFSTRPDHQIFPHETIVKSTSTGGFYVEQISRGHEVRVEGSFSSSSTVSATALNSTTFTPYYAGAAFDPELGGDLVSSWPEGINIQPRRPLYSIMRAGADTDGDGLTDAVERFIVGTRYTSPINDKDTDGDGFGDLYEFERMPHLNPKIFNAPASLPPALASDDYDLDGIPNTLETTLGTDPLNLDSDNDGISDAFEYSISSNPLVARQEVVSLDFQAALMSGWRESDNPPDWLPDAYEALPGRSSTGDSTKTDTDGDGLSSRQEWALGTRPDLVDTDGDLMADGWEVMYQFPPKVADDSNLDSDNDGLIDRLEYEFASNPRRIDSETASPSASIANPYTNSTSYGDGILDLDEILFGLNPVLFDSHFPGGSNSGLNNWAEIRDPRQHQDSDTLSDLAESILGSIPSNPDTDGDGMSDDWEYRFGLDPKTSAPASSDRDNDGIYDREEYTLGLLPNDFDSDGDGLGDKWEMTYGTNPASFRTGLLAWWRFDTLLGNQLTPDSASGRHLARLATRRENILVAKTHAPFVKSRPGDLALSLDGVNSWLSVPDFSFPTLSGDFTVALWFMPELNSLNQPRQLLDRRGAYQLEVVPDGQGSNRVRFTVFIGGQAFVFMSTAGLATGDWNHIAISCKRSTGELRLYLNGNAAGIHISPNLSAAFDPTPWPLIIGSQRTLPLSRTPWGCLDDIRIYGLVVSPTDVLLLATPDGSAVDPGKNPDTDGLVNLDEYIHGTDPLLTDSDGDTLSDGDELNHIDPNKRSKPRLADSDGDGLRDDAELNVFGTLPQNHDSDGDGASDKGEFFLPDGSFRNPPLSSSYLFTQNRRDYRVRPLGGSVERCDGWDTDGDRMPDGWELLHGFNPSSLSSTNTEALADSDEDGISNRDEYAQDKNPHFSDDIDMGVDNDSDKLPDWMEKYVYGTDIGPTSFVVGGVSISPVRAALYGLLPNTGTYYHGSPSDSGIGDAGYGLNSGNPSGLVPGGGHSSLTDPTHLTAAATLAVPVSLIPDIGEIAHNAQPPSPLVVPGEPVALRYRPGEKVFLSEEVIGADPNVITAVSKIYVRTLSTPATDWELVPMRSVKPDYDPYYYLGEEALVPYLYGAGYDISDFVATLPIDATGHVSFEVGLEQEKIYKRLPPPTTPTEPGGGDGNNGNPNGNNNGSGNPPGGSPFGWWNASHYVYNSPAGGFSPVTPVPPIITPPTKPTYATTRIMAHVLHGDLLVDLDRDGQIELPVPPPAISDDVTTTTEPFRFWSNDDDDDGDIANQGLLDGNSDEPGKLAGFWELDGRTPDHAHAGVDGRCDLLDFFPVYLDIKQLLAVLPTTTAGIEYKLKQADAALNFVYTDLTRDHAFDYLTKEAATYGTNFDKLPHMAETAAITAEGAALSTTFLDKIKNGTDKGVILVEGVKPSDKPLRLVVVKAGVEIAEVTLNVKISEVEKMYRWVNLRGSLGEFSQSVTRPTDTSEPANYPDARTNGKMFIWVHGYNVNEQQSRAWAAEGFKRLYQSGSRAMYTFISWHGDHSQIANSVAPDYWDNITNAFRTSALLPGVVAALPGTSKIITGHSMGNVVVGSAIVDHGLNVTKYFMLNAAMALEAYDTSALDIPSMRRNEWAGYDSRLWSTEWHQLFPAGDGRAGLTWKNRFGDIPNSINFYSSGEEVLNNNDAASGATPGEVPAIGSEWAWVGQEMIKGTYHIGAVLTFDIQGGWGFNGAWDIAETTTTHGPHGGTTTTYRTQTATEAAALLTNPDQLKTEPFFRRFQDDRLMTSGGSAAASEYITRADALGGAIPALSFPAGRNPIPRFGQTRNVDLMTQQDGWGRSGGRWFHSDAKNMAYRYNYKLFDTWVDVGGLK